MKQFSDVLREFEALGGRGVVYGGCLRDTITGHGPIKDIDIAVDNTLDNLYAIDAFAVGSSNLTIQHIGYGNFPDVVRSYQVLRNDGVLINFVVLQFDGLPFNHINVADRCDFGICQVSYTREFGLYRSAAFEEDLANKTFTYLRSPFDEAQYERSLRRFERFSERYVGWELRTPTRTSDTVALDPEDFFA